MCGAGSIEGSEAPLKIRKKALGPDDILNPKGTTARQLQNTALQAGYLSTVCAHWLNHKQEAWKAAIDEPTYDLPPSFPDAKRFNKARKLCGAWEPKGYGPKTVRIKFNTNSLFTTWTRNGKRPDNPDSIPVADPKPAAKWDWFDVFNYWLDGGLERNLEELLELMPRENRARVRKELDEF